MPEVAEESKLGRSDIDRFLKVVQRRHLYFLIPLFLGWLVVWGASWILPPRYKSSTLILVEQPSITNDYVTPNVSDDWQTRLQSIKQQILSRTRLLMIINNLHLYGDMQNSTTLDDKIDQMSKDIDVEIERDPGRADISAFRINYSASDPHVAQEVAGELSTLFISENQKVRQQLSQGTTNFMEQQLEEARESLAAQEAKVQAFQGQHEGALPDQQASNLQILSGLQTQLQNEQDSLNTAKQQKTYLEALLAQERAAQNSSHLTGADGRGISAPADLATIDDQLERLRAKYADLSAGYTDSYPDVQALKHQIERLEASRESLIAAEKAKSKEPKKPEESSTESDPTLSGPAQQTLSQLQANQVEITNREGAIADLKSRIGEYEGRLNMEPATEQQLTDLTRGYDQSKQNYDDLLRKKDESAIATSMEVLQQGERFIILDPPTLPTTPDFPNRLKFCAMGLGVGMALGLAVAGAFEFLDDRIHSGKEIKALLPMAILSEVPECVTPTDERNTKRRLVVGWVTTAIVGAAILTGSIVSFLAASPKS
jgi:polysaccharide chain length determinant protein (PEP-CTERM system associated)